MEPEEIMPNDLVTLARLIAPQFGRRSQDQAAAREEALRAQYGPMVPRPSSNADTLANADRTADSLIEGEMLDMNGVPIGRYLARGPDGRFVNRNGDQLSESALASLYRDLDPAVIDPPEDEQSTSMRIPPRNAAPVRRIPPMIGPRITIPPSTENSPYESVQEWQRQRDRLRREPPARAIDQITPIEL